MIQELGHEVRLIPPAYGRPCVKREKNDRNDPGSTIREISIEQILDIPGVAEADPIRAIQVLPGVVSTSDLSASLHVRGGSSDQDLILLDGVPVFSPFHLGGFFSVFNPDMVDRAELQSGGFPAEHGGRVSSVLAVETDPGNGELAVQGAVSLLAARVAVSGGLPQAWRERLIQSTSCPLCQHE